MAKQSKTPHSRVSKEVRSSWDRQERLARRAYELYVARGCQDGHDLDDWLEAERELDRVA